MGIMGNRGSDYNQREIRKNNRGRERKERQKNKGMLSVSIYIYFSSYKKHEVL